MKIGKKTKRGTLAALTIATATAVTVPSWATETTVSPVVVTASTLMEDQEKSAGSVTVIKPEKTKGEFKTLPDLLEQSAGIHVIEAKGRGGYSVASVRGSTAAQVAVYVDDILVNLGSESAVDLSAIPVENVETVEIYRGYIPPKFGVAGMGAVISITTKRPEKGQGSVTAGAGSFGERRLSGNYATPAGDGKLSMAFELGTADGDFPYTNRPVPGNSSLNYDTYRTNNGWDDRSLALRWENSDWDLGYSYKNRDRDIPMPAPGYDSTSTKIARTDQTTTRQDLFLGKNQGDWEWRISYGTQDKTFRDPDGDFDSIVPGNHRTEYDTKRLNADLNGSFLAGERHFFEWAARWGQETLDISEDENYFLINKDLKRYHYSQHSASATLQDTIILDEMGNLLLIPMVRWNYQDDEDHTSWSLGLNWKPGDDWLVKATYGRYNRAPNMYEKYGDGVGIAPNTDLEWEEGTHYDLGIHKTWEGENWSGRTGLTAFVLDTENLIEFIQLNQRYSMYRNIGKGHVEGLELESAFDWGRWRLNLACTWMDGENRSAGVRNGKKLRNRPELAWFARLTHDLSEKTQIFGEYTFTGDNYYSDDDTAVYDDLSIVNAGVRYRLNDDSLLVFGVDDVFDEGPERMIVPAPGYYGNERQPWYPLQGRTFHLSYSLKF
jgi:outer membrane cobalamin receptor